MAEAVGPGDRRRVRQLVELGPTRRGGAGRRRRSVLPRRQRRRDRRGVARRTSPSSASPVGRRFPRAWSTACCEWLAERGFGDVETVTAAEESLVFSLPQELRRDLKKSTAAELALHAEAAWRCNDGVRGGWPASAERPRSRRPARWPPSGSGPGWSDVVSVLTSQPRGPGTSARPDRVDRGHQQDGQGRHDDGAAQAPLDTSAAQ